VREREREKKREDRESVFVCLCAEKRASNHSLYSARARAHEGNIALVKESTESLYV